MPLPKHLGALTLGAMLLAGCASMRPESDVTVRTGTSTSIADATLFPSDRFTVPDAAQYTGLRIALPQPDCAVRVSECADLRLVNTLDGFNTQPRIAIPFTGDIDPSTLTSENVYFVNLGDARTGAGRGTRVGINQAVWDPASKTAFAESDQLLAEHARYLLVVTDGVRDDKGRRLRRAAGEGQGAGAHGAALASAIDDVAKGVRIVAASVFTTRSISNELVAMRRIAQAGPAPQPIDFMIATQAGARVRAAFDRPAISAMRFNRQVGTAPAFAASNLPLDQLDLRGPVISRVAYGRFMAPRYLNADFYIPTVPSLAGVPQALRNDALVVQVFLPAGTQPAAGWPVMIFGHGFGNSMFGGPWAVASSLAAKGIATVAIHVMGHGGGSQGTVEVSLAGGRSLVLPAGGRGEDIDGDGAIGPAEGATAKLPYASMVGTRDGMSTLR